MCVCFFFFSLLKLDTIDMASMLLSKYIFHHTATYSESKIKREKKRRTRVASVLMGWCDGQNWLQAEDRESRDGALQGGCPLLLQHILQYVSGGWRSAGDAVYGLCLIDVVLREYMMMNDILEIKFQEKIWSHFV